MAAKNKSYRIRTTVGREADTFLNVHLDQDYDSLEILSLKISDKDVYKLHNSDYGVIVGRVLANGNFGVPNAKVSVFIAADEQNSSMEMWNLYPYTTTSTKNDDDIRYNLLPDESVKDCHKAVGTFPNKTFLLDNDATIEVFDKYYVYTTRTNAAGDYLICGVPTGMQTLHMDLDLSDCGILSQRPRDFVYKGYTIEQFENPNQFKKDENLDRLSQIFSQNKPVYVQPFWGNKDNGEEIGITRADIEISFKFEPTCVFMGSAISDNASNGVGKKCVPTNQMGAMDELTAGEGTIEMIRKTPGGNVEEFAIKGNQVINGNGVWCYQIPMNLDYMMTDEYGNMVPTDDPEKGIPTRTRVRFRASLTDMDGSSQSYYRAKYLIPNNPEIDRNDVDYNFGTYTDESSYRDLFWNCVYTVKSFIPRFQKSKRWKSERFSGIKACNYYGNNNPMPYNNLRIKLPFMFIVLCIFVKLFIKIVTIVNRIQAGFFKILNFIIGFFTFTAVSLAGNVKRNKTHCTFIGDGLCPDMEGWYFAPACANRIYDTGLKQALFENTIAAAQGGGDAPDSSEGDSINSTEYTDETSIDTQNRTNMEEETVCLTTNVDYLVNCFEMNLANEYRVIKFDFYNDWVNGVLYFPRWMRKIKRKKKYKFSLGNGITSYYKDKVQGCMNSENSRVKKSRYYTQQCSLAYTGKTNEPWTTVTTPISCNDKDKSQATKQSKKISIFPSRCHKKKGMAMSSIFGPKSGLVTEGTTILGQNVYYLKPCEWKDTEYGRKRTLLFATDIVLIGTLNDCDENGIPQSFKYLNNTSYIMPTNLALTTMDDDSYIYSDAGGSLCISTNNKATPGDIYYYGYEKYLKDSVRRITPDFQSTNKAYSKTEDDQVDYGENDDPIPVTEAAGITWNYSGPGQDDVLAGKPETPAELLNRTYLNNNKKFNYVYYPGGHFLGLTCVNSETNIKSCVNLQRICEMGASMSQRREELRGYDEKGEPKYRYYIPTGLITNVDIEGASFRSMFATLNHNKLIATKINPKTYYKEYEFRFLRPDGFDGALTEYVHGKKNSPYNMSVGTISDASNYFLEKFASWSTPDDYDKEETLFSETRTIEDTVNDYYMFRFGLDTFSNSEQMKHYLSKNDWGYIMPQYENSFYFYFGLKDGATALDEFKKQFYSECESNTIMREPSISVVEKIEETEDNLECKAILIIDNMLTPYSIVLKDNTLEKEQGITNKITFTSNKDSIDLTDYMEMVIGHEYTVIVTDSLDRTLDKTFVFGADAVLVNLECVGFRYDRKNKWPVTIPNPKLGGYVKISDTVRIFGKEYKISEESEAINFKCKKINDTGGTIVDLTEFGSGYTDASGEKQHLYMLFDGVGKYEIYISYKNNDMTVSTVLVEDNSDVEVCVACDYLGYKSGYGLSAITEEEWYNLPKRFSGGTEDDWLIRHTFYRQAQNDEAPFDSYVYTNNSKAKIATFGWPESGGLSDSGYVLEETYYKDDYDSYPGYTIDESRSYIPTMYWNTETHEMDPNAMPGNHGRIPFDVMAYTEDGRAAASGTDIEVVSFTQDGDNLLIQCTKSDGDISGIAEYHGCIIVLENRTLLFPVITAITGNQIGMICYNTENPYAGVEDPSDLLSLACVYPTLRVPVIYKPFFGEVSALTWNLTGLTIERTDDGGTEIKRIVLPTSYKVEGTIHNGLTYDNHFYGGTITTEKDTGDDSEEGLTYESYRTYLIFDDTPIFYEQTTAATTSDFNYDRTIRFGSGSTNPAYTREITKNYVATQEVDKIDYSIVEGCPEISTGDPKYVQIFSGKYSNGFDLYRLEDECDFSKIFHENLRIIAFSDEGREGDCCLCADNEVNSATTELFVIPTENALFDDEGPLITDPITTQGGGIQSYCYGFYNKNAEYDIKGSTTTVAKGTFGYTFGKTQANGTKIRKTVLTEAELYNQGITLLHEFTLKRGYKKFLGDVTNIVDTSGVPVCAATLSNGAPTGIYTSFSNGIDAYYESVVEKYTRPDTASRNKMVIYKLYPVKALEVVYPSETTGLEPFISPQESIVCDYRPQTLSITVMSNVSFKVSSRESWATVDTSTTFGPETTSITVQVASNEGSNTRDRVAVINFTANEEGVSNTVTGQCTVTQLKDNVTPVEDKADQALAEAASAAAAAAAAEGAVSDLERNVDGEISDIWQAIHDLEPDGDND